MHNGLKMELSSLFIKSNEIDFPLSLLKVAHCVLHHLDTLEAKYIPYKIKTAILINGVLSLIF